MSDLISRVAAIEAITNYAKFLWDNYHETCNLAGMIDAIEALPTLDPVKHGDIEEAVEYIKNAHEYLRDIGETWFADYLSDAIELLVGERREDDSDKD